ncbi:MAG: hypothetical protein M3T49_06760 [Candidatus Eremiobacteraeota bacterium]|nr:hypothetical protein [Candidatus Eremiobacteraeota bacterium]
MKYLGLPVLTASCFILLACGGGGGSSVPSTVPTASPTVSPTSTASALATHSMAAAPSALAFSQTGSAYAQAYSVSETNYTGKFSASLCGDASVASVSSSDSLSFSVTPLGPGSCTIIMTDSAGRTAALSVSVTITSVTIR